MQIYFSTNWVAYWGFTFLYELSILSDPKLAVCSLSIIFLKLLVDFSIFLFVFMINEPANLLISM
jgi:hypothetical protein